MDTQTNDDVLKSDFFSRLSKMIPHKQRDTGKFYPIPRNFRMNVKKNKNEYDGGTILDPNTGKEYKSYIALESEDILKVRGYIGFSLMGRSQYWHRVK